MKKLFTLIALVMTSLWSAAQNDTLLYENFDVDPSGNANWVPIPAFPTNSTGDTMWYNYDADALPDQSGANPPRPGEWFWSPGGFADADSVDGCMFSNSWTLNSTTPVRNYLITPSISILDANATVSWESAPRQTPRYLDGYVVVVSTTTNDESQFLDTLFIAGENDGWNSSPTDSTFSQYYFTPTGPSVFIHGMDGTYVEYHGDSIRLIGQHRPFTASLAAYAGQNIYIAFVHYTIDDNLLSLDNILVKGTAFVGVEETNADAMKLYSYPNPAKKNLHLNFTLEQTSDVVIEISDVLGNVVLKDNLKNISGKYSYPVNVEQLAGGTYYYTVMSKQGRSADKFVVLK
jgi:hypothetical protein